MLKLKYNKILSKSQTHKNVYILECANPDCTNHLTRHISAIGSNNSVICCSRKCKKTEKVKHLLQAELKNKYGYVSIFQVPEKQKMLQQRVLEKYGVSCVFKDKEIKKKIIEGRIKKYGVPHVMQNKEISQKTHQTRILKYGKENLSGAIVTAPSKRTCLQKYGNERFFASDAGKMTRENLINRHGYSDEEVAEMFRSKGITLENLVKKYGDLEIATTVYNNWKKTCVHTYDNFLRRNNGDHEIATKKYFDYVNNRALYRSSHSKIADECIEAVLDRLPNEYRNRAFYGEREWFLRRKEIDKHIMYFYDLKIDNKILEFNGDYFHANPLKYNEDAFIAVVGVTAKEIWEKDIKKIATAQEQGYDVYVVWEYDYRKNKIEIAQKIINFILGTSK